MLVVLIHPVIIRNAAFCNVCNESNFLEAILLYKKHLVYCSGTYPGFRPGGGHLLSKGPPGYPGATWRLGAHWVIRGPSGNQGYVNETLIYIFLPSKRLSIVWKKYSGA